MKQPCSFGVVKMLKNLDPAELRGHKNQIRAKQRREECVVTPLQWTPGSGLSGEIAHIGYLDAVASSKLARVVSVWCSCSGPVRAADAAPPQNQSKEAGLS